MLLDQGRSQWSVHLTLKHHFVHVNARHREHPTQKVGHGSETTDCLEKDRQLGLGSLEHFGKLEFHQGPRILIFKLVKWGVLLLHFV